VVRGMMLHVRSGSTPYYSSLITPITPLRIIVPSSKPLQTTFIAITPLSTWIQLTIITVMSVAIEGACSICLAECYERGSARAAEEGRRSKRKDTYVARKGVTRSEESL